MNTMTIEHPVSKKSTMVRAWDIETKAAAEALKANGVKSFSWGLLSDKGSMRAMRGTDGGDSARNNFALNVLENALDWSLGLAVLNFIRDACAVKKCPRTFKVAASRKGDVFIIIARKDGTSVVLKY
jgi:hypothetical protein